MTNEIEWADPTVYVPYTVRIELARALPDPAQSGRMVENLERPADHVTLTPGFVFLGDPDGGSLNIPVEDVRSLRVTVTDRPSDYAHRPAIKAHEIGGDLPRDNLGQDGDTGAGDTSTRHADPFVADHYVVHVAARRAPTTFKVLARHDVSAEDVYRLGSWGFAARLPGDEATRIAEDPDVIEVEPDTGDRLAPYERAPADVRVSGYHIVEVRRNSRPRTVAARVGAVPDRVYEIFNWFGAELTDAQVLALRRDPDVNHIAEDATVTVD